jgi:hypothetical protein
VPKTVAARMAANVLIDIAIGAIPLLGDLFDVAFKANTRNLRLLEPYRQQAPIAGDRPSPSRPLPLARELPPLGMPWRYLVPIAAVLLIALALVLIGFITVVRWLFHF